MPALDTEERISILLKLLGDDLTDAALGELAPDKVVKIREQLREIDPDYLDSDDVDDVLDEFERILRYALESAVPSGVPADIRLAFTGDESAEAEPELEAGDDFVPSGHLQRDLNRMSPTRLAAVLEVEHSVTCALILQAMDLGHAGEVLDLLPPEQREAIFSALKTSPHARRELLDRLLQTTLDRAAQVNLKELAERRASADKKLASILRSMNRKNRFEILNKLAEEDPESSARIRDLLYNVNDVQRVENRTIQKLLGRIDTASLATIMKGADQAMQDKILSNLSKRAAASLREEIEFSGEVDDNVRAEASLRMVRAMMELDEKGELLFE